MHTRWLLALFAAALLLAACGGDDGSTAPQMNDGADSMHGGSEATDFGAPGEPADADREILIEANDSLEFDPAAIEVEEGETITFVVTNAGEIRHDFTLGNEDFQMAHEDEMAMEGMGDDDSNSLVLEPGETKSLTWMFTAAGDVLYGCHETGHYDAGMVGSITVM